MTSYKKYWKDRYEQDFDFYWDTDSDPLEGLERSRHPEMAIEQCVIEALDIGYAVGRVPAAVRLADFAKLGHETALAKGLYRATLSPLDRANGGRAAAHASSFAEDRPVPSSWLGAYEDFLTWSETNVAPNDSFWEAQVLSAYRLWLLASGDPDCSELEPLLAKLQGQSDEAMILKLLAEGDRSKAFIDRWEVFFDWVRDPLCQSAAHMSTWAVRLEHGILAARFLGGNSQCSVTDALAQIAA